MKSCSRDVGFHEGDPAGRDKKLDCLDEQISDADETLTAQTTDLGVRSSGLPDPARKAHRRVETGNLDW
jgi:hypothetical protein